MLEEANATHPGIEYTIKMTSSTALFLPPQGDQLQRHVEGRGEGYYRAQVYRDHEVVTVDKLDDWLIALTPMIGTIPEAENATRYYGDLRTGEISRTTPPR